ncbi:UDP-glycosyltransferase 72E1 [Cucumis melo var. makuwa]|uniref:UDP-glycosyltransferase 72E1 n=2 Tax=Cucumis melo TaxID=3656 RepID=A0A5A7T3W2_CUCMM|nr:UDP-glycosyltransferase 72E1 [Cucumis melo var. makuwa]
MPGQESKTHVALLVSPGMGHLIPFLELANRLVLHHNLQATLFVVGTGSSSAEFALLQKPSPVNIIPLPHASSSLDSNAPIFNIISSMMTASFPFLRSSIAAANPRPAALIVDLFGTPALSIAHELGMLGFVFMTTSAWFLSLSFFYPSFDKSMVDAHVDNHDPLVIPGCTPVRFENTIEVFELNQKEVYVGFGSFASELGTADGILSNTWQDLEPTTLKALSEAGTLGKGKVNEVPIFPIGPLTSNGDPTLESEVLKWLDRQPDESVIYVSFGSGGTLREEQITELAWGLEMSQQRFVWVIRPPAGTESMGTFFTAGRGSSGDDWASEFLPEGFIKRTKEVGLVIPMWGPQAEILSHRSVRGFVTHCGWNSSLESIVNGVAMVTWPLYAEQKMNAAVLTEEVGVAVRVRAEGDGLVKRKEIENKVRMIMEGKEGGGIRERVKGLKISGEKAVTKGGSSYNSLARVASECDIFRRRRDGGCYSLP